MLNDPKNETEAAGWYLIHAGKDLGPFALTDLINWAPLGKLTNTQGTMEFQDPNTIDHSERFYRIQLQ